MVVRRCIIGQIGQETVLPIRPDQTIGKGNVGSGIDVLRRETCARRKGVQIHLALHPAVRVAYIGDIQYDLRGQATLNANAPIVDTWNFLVSIEGGHLAWKNVASAAEQGVQVAVELLGYDDVWLVKALKLDGCAGPANHMFSDTEAAANRRCAVAGEIIGKTEAGRKLKLRMIRPALRV